MNNKLEDGIGSQTLFFEKEPTGSEVYDHILAYYKDYSERKMQVKIIGEVIQVWETVTPILQLP